MAVATSVALTNFTSPGEPWAVRHLARSQMRTVLMSVSRYNCPTAGEDGREAVEPLGMAPVSKVTQAEPFHEKKPMGL